MGKYFPNYYEQKIPMIKEYVKDKGILLLNEKERNGLEKIVPKEELNIKLLIGKEIFLMVHITRN